jgi:hypothetical protein
MKASLSTGLISYRTRLITPPPVAPMMAPIRKTTASGTETLPSLRWITLPMIALAKMWNRSVPTARMPLMPALIRAGAMMKPPPAPMAR